MTTIDPSKVYFTWPDAQLRYQCEGCLVCCKGLGIGVDSQSGELRRLVEHYPGLMGFSRLQQQTWTFTNPRGGCWFLEPTGLCKVEREHGRSCKPAACRLFPFNRVFRLGDWAIIDYNSVICPLRLADGGESQQAVLAEVSSIQDAAVVGTVLAEGLGAARADRLMEDERALSVALFESARWPLDSPEQVDAVLAAVEASMPVEAQFGRPSAMADRGFESVMGRAVPWPSAETLRNALTLLPSLRFNELFGPRAYRDSRWLMACFPGMTRVWLRTLALAEELTGTPVSMQTATTVWGNTAVLGFVCANWELPMHLGPAASQLSLPAGLARGPLERFVRAATSGPTAFAVLLEGIDEPFVRTAVVGACGSLLRWLSLEPASVAVSQDQLAAESAAAHPRKKRKRLR
ncbi:MAG: hypothetical protein AUK47_13690 [Deltaproteobacteria bacterium CG2_30_63_29]|nr:MAG: hypothetical protein AUK47_13690 [Deltaproteobacteria bacterium CG2_30_63_29]PIW02451.1 MAG: hypothetical protein COW42_01625 [Deltaproteobacteria bacterium CG17_big_fil_post_rev_8_21_14_2_50_63_7]